MDWNGQSQVESRETAGLPPSDPATRPSTEHLAGEHLAGEHLAGEHLAGEHLAGEFLTCEICGQRMSERHCKIVCPNCGYTRDCSDP